MVRLPGDAARDGNRIVTRPLKKLRPRDIVELVLPDGTLICFSVPHGRAHASDVLIVGPAALVYGSCTIERFDKSQQDT